MKLRICIPTAGTGSRLGDMTKYINKSLVDTAGKPAIAWIIEKFPEDAEFVIALGYKGALVREFLELAYPGRRFYFTEVSPYEGHGSGLGLTLSRCRPWLQQPFVFASCDTLVDESIPDPDFNWVGCAKRDKHEAYRTLVTANGEVQDILEKGEKAPGQEAYIGLAGVKDYSEFWCAMDTPAALAEGEARGLRGLLSAGFPVKAIEFGWHDTGTPENLAEAREHLREKDAPTILPKPNEAIWFVGDRVIKFSDNKEFISQRVERGAKLKGFVPKIVAATDHMYAYKKEEGEILSRCATPSLFGKLLKFSENFWHPAPLDAQGTASFRDRCMKFYRDKTLQRISEFYKVFAKTDTPTIINDRQLPTLAEVLTDVDWEALAAGRPGVYHGDFHFENILWNRNEEKFIFLDWRQNFAGNLHIGDQYYDFAKLLHGLIISHAIIQKNLFKIDWNGETIVYDFLRRNILVECEQVLFSWINIQNCSVKKTKVLTALIFLNIAALHHYPYSLLLYALGKDMLANMVCHINSEST